MQERYVTISREISDGVYKHFVIINDHYLIDFGGKNAVKVRLEEGATHNIFISCTGEKNSKVSITIKQKTKDILGGPLVARNTQELSGFAYDEFKLLQSG